jgi:invasion protein IalB
MLMLTLWRLAILAGLIVSSATFSGSAGAAGAGNIWYKLCSREPLTSRGEVEPGDVCQTIVDVRDNKTAILIGRLSISQSPGQKDYQLNVLLPMGSALPPGALVKIDDREPVKLAYKSCDAGGCYARAAVDDAFISQMRTGKKIAYLGIDVKGKALSIPLPLDRFSEAFDGPATPVDKYREDQKKITEVIAKRLLEAGKPAPAPPVKPVFSNSGDNAAVNSGWYKLCLEVQAPEKQQEKATGIPPPTKKTMVCLTQVDIRDAGTMVLAGKLAARKVDGKPKWEILAMLPLGFSIPDGAEVQIDKKPPIKLSFSTCDAAGCYAQADISDQTVEDLKNGQEATYSGTDEKGGSILVPVALAGFKDAFNGNPTPIETYNAEMRRIADEILIRAAKRRKEQRQ